jgi:cytosine deaminase
LDKAHLGNLPLADGTLTGAIAAVEGDRPQRTAEDLRRRMEFALTCAYVHGTKVIRTHLDLPPTHRDMVLTVFRELQEVWQGRLLLQPVSLVDAAVFLTPEGERLADRLAAMGGVLGALALDDENLPAALGQMLTLAQERGLDVDFHADENGDPFSDALRHIANAVLRSEFPGRVLCGHCCSLTVQPEAVAAETIARVKAAGIGVVSLPACNLYLQDRTPGWTPRWRGIPPLHELKAAGIPVAIGHDNCRDPFYPYGDQDLLQAWAIAVLVGHLHPKEWIGSITRTAADLLGLAEGGRIAPGEPADFMVFAARSYGELLSRPQSNRRVFRNGVEVTVPLPSYRQLRD